MNLKVKHTININIYYKEVTLPQFLQNYKETKTKFQALKNIVRIKTGTKSQ